MAEDSTDRHLKNALIKAYAARATLFHRGVNRAEMRTLFRTVDEIDSRQHEWRPENLHITEAAFNLVRAKGIAPHKIFAHPVILEGNPRLVNYYRNLVAVSQKGLSQLGYPSARFERQRPAAMDIDTAVGLCRTLNSIISRVIESDDAFQVESGRDVVFAELGTELQGSWANTVGKGASKAVEDMVAEFIARESRGEREGKGRFRLNNQWTIVFGTEPDVRFMDPAGVDRLVIEIKGSLDKAGAQTRYGEAKKSFAKALARNPRCQTVYLASCFTEAVVQQIESDGQVRDTFNLTSILYDSEERDRFMRRIFHIVDTPT